MQFNILNEISFMASIASLVLAVVAIWLSLAFYKLSNATAEKANEASKSIMSSVEKLEKIFDKLYSDTFSIMRDTVSDMRKHVWKEEPDEIDVELEVKTKKRINALKSELLGTLSTLLAEQNKTGSKIHELESALSSLLEKAVSETKIIESQVKEETMRDYIIKAIKEIKNMKRRPIVDFIIEKAVKDGVNPKIIIDELHKMKDDKYIYFDGEKIQNGAVEVSLIKEIK